MKIFSALSLTLLALLFAISTFGQLNLDSGLVAFYKFENNVLDSSGNNLDGTIYGNPQYVVGKSGQGMDFDGVSDYVIINNNSLFNVSDFSLSAWIKWEGDPTAQGTWAIVSNWYGGGFYEHFGLRMGTVASTYNHGVFFYDDGSEWDWVYGMKEELSNGQWHSIVGTLSAGDTARMYIDGSLYEIDATSIPLQIIPTGDLYIARDGYGESLGQVERWDGVIDEVRIYNRTLSQEEIGEIYLGGLNTINSIIKDECQMHCYPNPSEDFINIQIENTDNLKIEIINTNGQFMLNKEFNTEFEQIDISGYPKGVYFIRLKSEEFIITEKVIKY